MSTGHGSKRIHLNDALEDTPKTRALISEFEQGTLALHDFTVTLLTNCRIVADLQAQMTKATGNLANHLSEGKNLVFAQKNPFLGTALDQLGESMQQLQSWQDMLHIQIQEAVMQPLNTFFQEELINVEKTKETYSGAVQDHENAMSRYSRVSKKKETEKNRFEANADLYTARKKYHQVAMQYYSTLNLLQSKQSYSVLDPLINLMHAQLSYFKMGHEILTEEVAKFLTTLSVQAQKDRSEHNIENRKLSSLREKIEQEYSSRYNPDPDPSDPFSDVQPADRSLKEKAGYLYTKNVKPGPSRGQWERAYFHTDNGMLMCQLPDTKTAEPTMLLDPSARAGTLDCDDRRYCFQVVSSHTKEPILLQAENDVTREEWVSTILNIVAELTHKAETPASGDVGLMSSTLSAKDVKEERQRVATWVEDVLKVEGERNTPQVQRSAVPTQTPPAHQVQPAQDATQGAMAAAAVAGGGAAGGGAMGATAMPGTQQLQQQQQQQQPSMAMQPAVVPTQPVPPMQSPAVADGNTTDGGMQAQDKLAEAPRSFSVRFLGSLEVQFDRGIQVVEDTCKRVMQARTAQHVRSSVDSVMVISSRGFRLIHPNTGIVRTEFRTQDVSFFASHRSNQKMFGLISRSPKTGTKACHVFETQVGAKELCGAMQNALQRAYQMYRQSIQPKQQQQSLQRQPQMQQQQHQQQQQQQQQQVGGGMGAGMGAGGAAQQISIQAQQHQIAQQRYAQQQILLQQQQNTQHVPQQQGLQLQQQQQQGMQSQQQHLRGAPQLQPGHQSVNTSMASNMAAGAAMAGGAAMATENLSLEQQNQQQQHLARMQQLKVQQQQLLLLQEQRRLQQAQQQAQQAQQAHAEYQQQQLGQAVQVTQQQLQQQQPQPITSTQATMVGMAATTQGAGIPKRKVGTRDKEWQSLSGQHGAVNDMAAQNSWSTGSPDEIEPYGTVSVANRTTYVPSQSREQQQLQQQAQQQQQQQQQTSMMPAAASTAMGAAAAGAQPSFTTGQPSAAADDDATAIYATVNKSAHKAGQASTERPDSVSPVSSDSSTTTTSTTSTSSSDAEAALAGLTIAQHPSMTDARENPFNRLSPGASFPPGQVTSGVPGSGGWQPSALPDHFQGDFSHPEPAVVVETVESPADNNDLEPSPLVTEMAMSLTSLSALHSGLVAPSTTPAVAGLLDTAAADAAMAVAMAAAATLHEADNEDDDGAGLERSPSQSSLLSDLSDS
ncbi:DCC-interacting protein 13-alpha-like [Sycon ciliatum]|uniref:DCC-interacting protein 13-alpha-like n=1 Tax=Sycon ciliatum TaxID=27933 RepID=UPI0031F655BE